MDKCKRSVRVTDVVYDVITPINPRFGECHELRDEATMPLQAADMQPGIMRQTHKPSPRFHVASAMLNGIQTGEIDLNTGSVESILGRHHELDDSSSSR